MLAWIFSALLPLQSTTEPPAVPPSAPDAPPAEPAAAPIDPAVPSTESATAPADPAASTAPATPATTPPPAKAGSPATPAADQRSGVGPVATGAAQIGAGVGACCIGTCVAFPCAFIPYVGGVFSNLMLGLMIGGTEAFVGDAIGQQRAALLWPALTSAGIVVLGGIVNFVVTNALGISPSAIANITSDPAALTGTLAVPLGISLGTVALAVVAPAVVYGLTAVDKEPGDTGGFSMPGLLEPADPTGSRKRETPPTAPAATPATPSEPPPPAALPSGAP